MTRFTLLFVLISSFAFGCSEESASGEPTFAQMMEAQDECEAACGNMQTQCGVASPGCVQACTQNLQASQRQCIASASSCEATEFCTMDDRVAAAPAQSESATQ